MKKYLLLSGIAMVFIGTVALWEIHSNGPKELCSNIHGKEEQQSCFNTLFTKRAIASNQIGLCAKTGDQQKYCVQSILQAEGVKKKEITPCTILTSPNEKAHCQKGIVENLNAKEQTQEYCTLLGEETRKTTLSCTSNNTKENEKKELPSTSTKEMLPEENTRAYEATLLPIVQKTKNITLCSYIGDSDMQIACVTEILKKFPEEKNRPIVQTMKENYCNIEKENFTVEQQAQLKAYAPLTELCRLL